MHHSLNQVNFNSLHMNVLKRYKKHYKLTQETNTKQELVDVRFGGGAYRHALCSPTDSSHSPNSPHSPPPPKLTPSRQLVSAHFSEQDVEELESIVLFVYTVHSDRGLQ